MLMANGYVAVSQFALLHGHHCNVNVKAKSTRVKKWKCFHR